MGRRIQSAAVLVLASIVLASPARAAKEFLSISPWVYELQGGTMHPAGAEGAGLETGLHLGGSLGYEFNPAIGVWADLGHDSSTDPFKTRILRYGVHGRLAPNSDFTVFYLEAGLGAYHISYHPEEPGLPKPAALTRFGGSMGVGVDFATAGKLTFGVSGTYHGVVMAASDALSFLTLALSVSLRPGAL